MLFSLHPNSVFGKVLFYFLISNKQTGGKWRHRRVASSLHYRWFPLRDCPMAIATKNAIYSAAERKTEAKRERRERERERRSRRLLGFYAANTRGRNRVELTSVGSTFCGNCSCFRDQSAPPFVTREREAVPRPLSFSDRSERPIEGGSTMNSEGAKGQHVFGCERIERKEFPYNTTLSLLASSRPAPNMIS